MYERARARVYTCDFCGRTATVVPEVRGWGVPGYYLPAGWAGSYRKRGVCLCDECAEAYRDALWASRGLSEGTSGDSATESPETGEAGARGDEGGQWGDADGR